ncbi:MAG: hypothetical protein CM15mV6_2070 [uncultured marine virus]|nr:MAG: hypothetical protein CM15mV6_2070 [uncultured marine virus]
MAQLFGYSLDRKKKLFSKGPSFVRKDSEDAAEPHCSRWLLWSVCRFWRQRVIQRYEMDLIGRYREMSLHPEADAAINDVVNEAIAGELDDHPIDLELSNLQASDTLKKRIREEFENVLSLLDFDRRAYDIFRRWYIDGRLFYHKMINPDKPSEGITELRYIDPRKIKKLSNLTEERADQV